MSTRESEAMAAGIPYDIQCDVVVIGNMTAELLYRQSPPTYIGGRMVVRLTLSNQAPVELTTQAANALHELLDRQKANTRYRKEHAAG